MEHGTSSCGGHFSFRAVEKYVYFPCESVHFSRRTLSILWDVNRPQVNVINTAPSQANKVINCPNLTRPLPADICIPLSGPHRVGGTHPLETTLPTRRHAQTTAAPPRAESNPPPLKPPPTHPRAALIVASRIPHCRFLRAPLGVARLRRKNGAICPQTARWHSAARRCRAASAATGPCRGGVYHAPGMPRPAPIVHGRDPALFIAARRRHCKRHHIASAARQRHAQQPPRTAAGILTSNRRWHRWKYPALYSFNYLNLVSFGEHSLGGGKGSI